MVDEIDKDGNGEIDFDEFVTVMSRKVNTSYTPAQVKSAFKVFERDCPNGFVSMAALEQALTTYGSEKLSLSDAQELLSQIEPDENGQINYVEFVNMMCAQASRRRLAQHAPQHPARATPSTRLAHELTAHATCACCDVAGPLHDRDAAIPCVRWPATRVCCAGRWSRCRFCRLV
tara:strand:- start:1221 stop:1745 length:525 start_codon:yes stop_codon:yes gene_type:complete